MPPWLCVALGSAAGGVARWLVTTALQRPGTTWPAGTFAVNVAGSLLLGFLARRLVGPDAALAWLLLATGFCGGFTTFSAFELETHRLLLGGAWMRAVLYVLASVLVGLLAMRWGLLAGRALVGRLG
jgi:fluoride exporter